MAYNCSPGIGKVMVQNMAQKIAFLNGKMINCKVASLIGKMIDVAYNFYAYNNL